MSDYKELQSVPAYEAMTPDGPRADGALIWSGDFPPPPVGAIVRVTVNGLGSAEVVGYFSEGGYLGLRTKLRNPPDWYLRQNGSNVICGVFGIECKPVEVSS